MNKYKNELYGGRILLCILQFGTVDMIYTTKMFCELLDIDTHDATAALEWLHTEGHVTSHLGMYDVTDDGIDLAHAMGEHPTINLGDELQDWKDEVLSGLTQEYNKATKKWVSARSDIDTAVLPTAERHASSQSPEDIYLRRVESLEDDILLAEHFDISLERLHLYQEEGRIKQCGDHVGIFDRDRKHWKSKCRACRKEDR